MDKERAFKDLLALCVKRWKTLIIGMIIGALVMGYVQYDVQMERKNDPEISEEAIEERYKKAMDEYNAKIKEMDDKIAADEKTIKINQEYIDNSLLMKIDPYNKYVSVVDVAVDINDEVEFSKNFGYATTPIDYMIGKVKTQYLSSYNNIDVRQLDGIAVLHENLDLKYWNEVLSVVNKDGFIIELYAEAPSENEAKAITDALFGFLTSKTDIVSQTSYPHELLILSEVTKVVIDTALEETQNTKKNAVFSAQSDIEVQNQNKLNLELPEREKGFDEGAMKAAVKQFAIMGLGVGLIGAMFVIMLHAIAVRQVITSEEVIKNCNLTYLGTLTKSTYKRKMVVRRFSDYLSGERLWKTNEAAVEFILSSLNATMVGEKIVITSTQKLKEDDIGIQTLKKALEEEKKEVIVLFDAPHNAQLIRSMKEANTIILLEKSVASRMNAIDAVKEACEKAGVHNIGFVMMTK